MAINTIVDNGGEDDDWEEGPITNEEVSRDEPAPELPSSEELDAQLKHLEANEPEMAQEPEIADEGVSPIHPDEALKDQLQTLETNEPFQPQAHQASAAVEPISQPASPDISDMPEDDPQAPPATLKDFYEAGGTIQGGLGALPGIPGPRPEEAGEPLKQYIQSAGNFSQATADFLLDHTQQLDGILERLERGRL